MDSTGGSAANLPTVLESVVLFSPDEQRFRPEAVLAAKRRDSSAQGNALGCQIDSAIVALKGRNQGPPRAFASQFRPTADLRFHDRVCSSLPPRVSVAPRWGAETRYSLKPRALPWADEYDPFGVEKSQKFWSAE
jgi:hypothetical protein